MYLYKIGIKERDTIEFIADITKQETDWRERAKIARAGGYTVKFIESVLRKRRNENEGE